MPYKVCDKTQNDENSQAKKNNRVYIVFYITLFLFFVVVLFAVPEGVDVLAEVLFFVFAICFPFSFAVL